MSDGVKVDINTQQLEEALTKLPEKLQRTVLRTALEQAGDVILEAMVRLAPERTDEPTPESRSLPPGILRADLHTEVKVDDGVGRVKIGPSEIAGHVARWQNNGWMLTKGGHRKTARRQSGKGTEIREIPGKHFMEGAFDETSERALTVFIYSLEELLEEDK